jgi:hypothetical protein
MAPLVSRANGFGWIMERARYLALPAITQVAILPLVRNPGGAFRLFRIGDAVASRNIHAAIFDALRLAKDL